MTIVAVLIAALVVVILTEVVKKYVNLRPEALAGFFSVIGIFGTEMYTSGAPPGIEQHVGYAAAVYVASALGYDKFVQPTLKSLTNRRE